MKVNKIIRLMYLKGNSYIEAIMLSYFMYLKGEDH